MWINEIPESLLDNVTVIERLFSTLSLIGAAFIVSTFLFARSFQKPINRVIFYASAGNVFTNVGTIISRGALHSIEVEHGMLCQFQGVLIQTVMSLATVTIYLRLGFTIYYKKIDLDRLNEPAAGSSPMFSDQFCATRTTEITYTSEAVSRRSNSVILQRIRAAPPVLATSAPVQAFCPDTYATPVYSGAQQSYKCEITAGEIKPKTQGSTNIRRLPQGTDPVIHVEASSSPLCRERSSLAIQVSGPMTSSERKNPSTGSSALLFSSPTPITPGLGHRNTRVAKQNLYAWIRVSLMFVAVMAITWIPSSANRLYTVYHPGQVLPVLLYLAAIVLPLQGFWNAVIYIYSSWDLVKELWVDMKNMVTAEDRSWRIPGVCELAQMVRDAWSAMKEAFAPEEELILLPIWRRRCRSYPRTPAPARQKDDTESTMGLRDNSWPVTAENASD
ncbi:hypothetical protein QTJ16_001119 [Diplocarpon rosae]|uniref:Uncharacterized protein n=1 Tax=Diplocarpon rosae TaxID=946125 RepID=A0AAD9T7K3_9HELO|nr:hypothetical protein QTJ16_001119 [Diplocarpon rosae]